MNTPFNSLVKSNFFKVRDIEQFEMWCRRLEFNFQRQEDPQHGTLVGFSLYAPDVPSVYLDMESNQPRDVDVWAELADHLPDGEVAMVMAAGNNGTDVEAWCVLLNNRRAPKGLDLSKFFYAYAQDYGNVRSYPFPVMEEIS